MIKSIIKILLIIMPLSAFCQTEADYGNLYPFYSQLKDSILSENGHLLKNKDAIIFSHYNNNSILICGNSVYYFKENETKPIDRVSIKDAAVKRFLKYKLTPSDIVSAKLIDTSAMKYLDFGYFYFFECINGKTVFNFYKPISRFWWDDEYHKFVAYLYMMHLHMYARNVKK